MPPRTRRLAAVAAAALVADMQLDSDEEMDEDDQELDVDDVDEDGEGEDDEMDDEQLVRNHKLRNTDSLLIYSQNEDYDPPPTSRPVSQPTKLKITLKLPANNTSSNSVGTSTPDDAEMDYAAFKRTPRRRAKRMLLLIQNPKCLIIHPYSKSHP
jgi:Ino eighty subunit 2